MSLIGREIECDGGPYCQATEHIEGCFADQPLSAYARVKHENIALRDQLAGAVSHRNSWLDAAKGCARAGDMAGVIRCIDSALEGPGGQSA